MYSAEIDFVVLWVDGNDPKWRKELNKYSSEVQGDKSEIRFRDWDNLHFLFRAFEQFTPWVSKIHFVTWGHVPAWMDTKHPKLHIVNHEDYVNRENLPVFNANPIEINIHGIEGLSNKFVFFNDDLFLTSEILEERFFKNGLPCDSLISNALSSSSGVGHFVLNNLEILNRNFSKQQTIQKNLAKYFNYKYGSALLRNLALLPWPRFTGFVDPHMPQPFLKSVFTEVWDKEKTKLEETSASKFRSCSDINQYLFRYWQLASGQFSPISMTDTKYIDMTMDLLRSGDVEKVIKNQKYNMICLNDSEDIDSEEKFNEAKELLKNAFEKILPNKSGFEI